MGLICLFFFWGGEHLDAVVVNGVFCDRRICYQKGSTLPLASSYHQLQSSQKMCQYGVNVMSFVVFCFSVKMGDFKVPVFKCGSSFNM